MYVSVRVSEQSFNLYFHAYLLTWFVHSSIWNLCLWHISLCAFFYILFPNISLSLRVCLWHPFSHLFSSLPSCSCLSLCVSVCDILSPFVITYLFVDLLMCCCCLPPSSLRHAQWRCRISEIIFLRQIASSSQRLTLTYFNFSSQCVTHKHFFLVGFLGAA